MVAKLHFMTAISRFRKFTIEKMRPTILVTAINSQIPNFRDLRRSGQMMRTKIAIVCGQTVLLYSLDGQRWFSRERLA